MTAGRVRLRELQPRQGDRLVRRRCLEHGPAGGPDCAADAGPFRSRAIIRSRWTSCSCSNGSSSLIATGTGVPTRKVLVDKDAILELIDQLRVAVPEEVHAAKRINAEGERIIEKAG